jgi:hypothetical protein
MEAGNTIGDAMALAAEQALQGGTGPKYPSNPGVGNREYTAFEGSVTFSAPKALAIFSDDGCRVTIKQNGATICFFDRYGRGQHLPSLNRSFHVLPVVLEAGNYDIEIWYSNTFYGGDTDIDGATLFTFDPTPWVSVQILNHDLSGAETEKLEALPNDICDLKVCLGYAQDNGPWEVYIYREDTGELIGGSPFSLTADQEGNVTVHSGSVLPDGIQLSVGKQDSVVWLRYSGFVIPDFGGDGFGILVAVEGFKPTTATVPQNGLISPPPFMAEFAYASVLLPMGSFDGENFTRFLLWFVSHTDFGKTAVSQVKDYCEQCPDPQIKAKLRFDQLKDKKLAQMRQEMKKLTNKDVFIYSGHAGVVPGGTEGVILSAGKPEAGQIKLRYRYDSLGGFGMIWNSTSEGTAYTTTMLKEDITEGQAPAIVFLTACPPGADFTKVFRDRGTKVLIHIVGATAAGDTDVSYGGVGSEAARFFFEELIKNRSTLGTAWQKAQAFVEKVRDTNIDQGRLTIYKAQGVQDNDKIEDIIPTLKPTP